MVNYINSSSAWGADETVKVAFPGNNGQDGVEIAQVPLAFLAQSGCNTWQYVLEVVKICVGGDGCIESSEGAAVMTGTAPPTPGSYLFKAASGQVSFSEGPAGKSKVKAPTGTTVSTWSNSARSSINQSSLRLRLIARDFSCLLTDTQYDNCIAAHMIPVSRSDIWFSFGVTHPYTVDCGLLLSGSYHTAFDRYDWSLYWNDMDKTFTVHYFQPSSIQEMSVLHGKVIPRARFRVRVPSDYPNVKYLRWHYRQCVMKNLRAFYVPA